jgi:hypothetical protein
VELANGVKSDEKLKAVGDLLALSGELDWDTLLEVDLDILWGGRCGHRVISAAKKLAIVFFSAGYYPVEFSPGCTHRVHISVGGGLDGSSS